MVVYRQLRNQISNFFLSLTITTIILKRDKKVVCVCFQHLKAEFNIYENQYKVLCKYC